MDDLLKNKKIKRFLIEYPKNEWMTCVEALLVHSISSLSKKYPFGLKADQLRKIAHMDRPNRAHHSSHSRKVNSHPKRSHSNQGGPPSHQPKVSASPPLPFKAASPNGKLIFKTADMQRPTSETLKIPRSDQLNEPKTCPIQDAHLFMSQLKPSLSTSLFLNKPNLNLPSSTEVMKIAEDFLASPFTSHIAKDANSRNNLY